MILTCNQREAVDRIANLVPFKASALSGSFTADGVFEVRSYVTPILTVHPIGNARINTFRYSPTTDHHRAICYRACLKARFHVTEYEGEPAQLLDPGAARRVEVFNTLNRPRRNPADGPRLGGMVYHEARA